MILEKLMHNDNLTPNEKLIADYLLSHISEISELTLRDLASKTYVSPPTVTRLCKKVGAKNFTSFKVKLMEEYVEQNKEIKSLDDNFPFIKGDLPETIVSNLAEISIKVIKLARDNFDYITVRHVIKEIEKSKFVDIYASGMSQKVAGSFVEKMNRIGYPTTTMSDSSLQVYRANSSGKNQFAIVISYSGMTRNAMKCMELLEHTDTKVLLITGNRLSPMISKADYVYYMLSDEDIAMGNKLDGFGELMMLHYILDAIYGILFAKNYDENVKLAKSANSKQFVM